MKLKECAWCGDDITADVIKYHKLFFCSAECRDDYQDDLAGQTDEDLADVAGDIEDADLSDLKLEDSDYLDEDLDEDLDDDMAYEADQF